MTNVGMVAELCGMHDQPELLQRRVSCEADGLDNDESTWQEPRACEELVLGWVELQQSTTTTAS